jgi:hypothetical protein
VTNETNDAEEVGLPEGPVRFHPLCQAFPVAPEHELQGLAESIKTSGRLIALLPPRSASCRLRV